MNEKPNLIRSGNRRSFLKTALTAAGATAGTGFLVQGTKALAQSSSSLAAGDAAILRFLAAGEALEVDFWTQYNELAGIPDDEVSGGGGNRAYAHCPFMFHHHPSLLSLVSNARWGSLPIGMSRYFMEYSRLHTR